MPSVLSPLVALLCLLGTTSAAPVTSSHSDRRDSTSSEESVTIDLDNVPSSRRSSLTDEEPRALVPLPFKKMIAFGDDYTDNGQGSYAHGITGNRTSGKGKHLWGANTWTDGKVAVSYLAQNLGIPLAYDYAFGSSGGGAELGSICNNSVIPPDKYGSHAMYNHELVPDALSQIANYTDSDVFNDDIENTLHFFWTGNNDVIPSLGWTGRFTICTKDTKCIPGQDKFVERLSNCYYTSLMNLVNAGAKHIFVPNIFPRNLTPWQRMWISNDPAMMDNFGAVIDRANQALKADIDQINKEQGTKIMYYDANGFMKRAMNNPLMVQGAAFSNTCVDGCKVQAVPGISNWNMYWKNTVTNHLPDDFFWMTEVVASTTVHKAMAQDMMNFISSRYVRKP